MSSFFATKPPTRYPIDPTGYDADTEKDALIENSGDIQPVGGAQLLTYSHGFLDTTNIHRNTLLDDKFTSDRTGAATNGSTSPDSLELELATLFAASSQPQLPSADDALSTNTPERLAWAIPGARQVVSAEGSYSSPSDSTPPNPHTTKEEGVFPVDFEP